MLQIHKQETFAEVPEVTVWQDDSSETTFYAMPQTPRFRMQDGKPVFKFIQYRLPVDRPDGKKGGGFVFFDAELSVAPEKMVRLEQILQQRVDEQHKAERRPGTPPKVRLGTIIYTRGTVSMLLDKDGVLVERVRGGGKPSLFGSNVATFAIELTPAGASVFKAAMQGDGASLVSLQYDMNLWVKLPPLKATVRFHSDKFYSFFNEASTEVSSWSEDHYREELRELLRESESTETEISLDFTLPDQEQDKKLKDKIRDWAQRVSEDMVTRAAQQTTPGLNDDQRKVPAHVIEDLDGDDLDQMMRNITVNKLQDMVQTYKEDSAAEWNLVPQGNLGTITSIVGPDGKPLEWDDYAMEVDADDPFFRQLNVSMQVNADFKNLPLHSVELHIEYSKADGSKNIGEYRFAGPDDVAKFAAYIDNDNWEYKYWYEVNFKGASRTFKSPTVTTDEKILTVNLDQTGILSVDLVAGDLDWEQVRAAQVTVKYQDTANNVPLVQQVFALDAEHPTQRFQKLIFQPQAQPYEYRVKYIMGDGKEYQGDWIKDFSAPLIVNDPFSENKQVRIRASGNLSEQVESIFVDLTYNDQVNRYTQSHSVILSEMEPVIEWLFPLISGSNGTLRYSGTIKYRDGTEEPIPEQDATSNTIVVGPRVRERLEVTVLPDFLFDDPDVRLVRISLSYPPTGARKDFTFRPGDMEPTVWLVDQQDNTLDEYTWQATFFMNGGIQRKIQPVSTSELTLVPELALAV